MPRTLPEAGWRSIASPLNVKNRVRRSAALLLAREVEERESVLDGLGGRSKAAEAIDDVEDALADVDSRRRFSSPCCFA